MPIAADPTRGETFERFLTVFVESGLSSRWPAYPLRPASPRDLLHGVLLGGAVGLMAFRRLLGRVLALDGDRDLPIPGGSARPAAGVEHRIRERLDAADHARDTGALPRKVFGAFETVYAFADEALLEIANRTIHGMLHLSWVERADGRRSVMLAVYVKSRGWQSRAYLALIRPFRHLIVYPAWISHLTRSWDARRPVAAPS